MRQVAPTLRCLILLLLSTQGHAVLGHPRQAGSSPPQPATEDAERAPGETPLPDIAALMRQVETNQRTSETLQKSYLFHSVQTMQELGSGGEVKKTTSREADHFWLNGVPVEKVTRRDGKDLSPAELAKEDERIDKETRKQHQLREEKDARGKETDPHGHDEVTVSRLLELGAFTNERRVDRNGRATIAVDYTGDQHTSTHNRAEDVMKDLAGTVWIDEADKVIVHLEGRFARDFKIGGGVVADIHKDTHFAFDQARVNGEVWLPARIDAQGQARALLLFKFAGRLNIAYSDYRKFRATATVLPDVTPVETAPAQREGATPP
ncbi:MAG: hypothetical protein M3O02_11845 [Acidobacteriota bacterium]|nr:hypothetical protein [Acidobacteriota bacterium]